MNVLHDEVAVISEGTSVAVLAPAESLARATGNSQTGDGRQRKGSAMNEVDLDFVDRYVALWNEPDADVRRRTIEELWAPDGSNYTPAMQAVGYEALDARVTSAYETYVGSGKYTFRPHVPAVGHHGVVKVIWEMVTDPEEEIASIGIEFLVLDDQGRIASDHQFIVQ
jgi:hypothetical protein